MDGTFVIETKYFGYDLAKKLKFLSTSYQMFVNIAKNITYYSSICLKVQNFS